MSGTRLAWMSRHDTDTVPNPEAEVCWPLLSFPAVARIQVLLANGSPIASTGGGFLPKEN